MNIFHLLQVQGCNPEATGEATIIEKAISRSYGTSKDWILSNPWRVSLVLFVRNVWELYYSTVNQMEMRR